MVNPEHQSLALGLIGLRAYWLWWAAPIVIAGVLQNQRQKDKAIYALLVMALGISALAAVQFASPADSSVNLYSVEDGEEVHASDMATVASTGRARVSSTFTFLSGFVDFTMTVPALLLSLGLDSRNPRLRRAALLATFATAAVIPMSGSRGSVVLGVVVILGITMWSAGLFFTAIGRRILMGSIVAAILSVVAFPDAFLGVQSRFENTDETVGRFEDLANILPPVAITTYEYPFMGIGTGMQQNSKGSLHVFTKWDSEGELGRYLIELGPIGFLLIWMTKLGLMVALWRAFLILKRAGRRGPASAALSYAAMTMFGNLGFDHNWQALFFLGCGFVLSDVLSVLRAQAAAAAPQEALPPRAELKVAV